MTAFRKPSKNTDAVGLLAGHSGRPSATEPRQPSRSRLTSVLAHCALRFTYSIY